MVSASEPLPIGYSLSQGSRLDRALLVRTMQRTYRELHPGQPQEHLAHTVERYLSQDSSLWWVKQDIDIPASNSNKAPSNNVPHLGINRIKNPAACLWLGEAIDQVDGDRHTYVFLLYVDPKHRRRGIGTALMRYATNWAKSKGDRKISLQVFSNNTPAMAMYEQLGFHPQSVWMSKSIG